MRSSASLRFISSHLVVFLLFLCAFPSPIFPLGSYFYANAFKLNMETSSLNTVPALILNKIYEIRGQKVMLDFDLAELYSVETKILNQAVKRNSSRFPEDFMFKLTQEEWNLNWSRFVTSSKKHRGNDVNLKSQIVTSSWGGSRKLPYAFTEHGVTMLASILRSERAVKMNIAIVRAFIALRQLALQHKDLATQLGQLQQEMYERFGEHDTQLTAIYKAIENMLVEKEAEKKEWEERERIGFKK